MNKEGSNFEELEGYDDAKRRVNATLGSFSDSIINGWYSWVQLMEVVRENTPGPYSENFYDATLNGIIDSLEDDVEEVCEGGGEGYFVRFHNGTYLEQSYAQVLESIERVNELARCREELEALEEALNKKRAEIWKRESEIESEMRFDDLKLEVLNLHPQARSRLIKAGYTHLFDLRDVDYATLISLRKVGKDSIAQLQAIMLEHRMTPRFSPKK
jgi:hypothetical protein